MMFRKGGSGRGRCNQKNPPGRGCGYFLFNNTMLSLTEVLEYRRSSMCDRWGWILLDEGKIYFMLID